MTKKELRIKYRAKRLALSDTERMKMDDLLLIQFQKLSFEHVSVLLSYMPMPHAAEPETRLVTRYLEHIIPGLQTAYPVTDFSTASMYAVATTEETEFAMNAFHITEPAGGLTILPPEIDLVLVPLLICDRTGQRVGYGKGFYDRYLQQCSDDIIKVGFSYFEPEDRIDDCNPHDVPLSYCITPQHIYEF